MQLRRTLSSIQLAGLFIFFLISAVFFAIVDFFLYPRIKSLALVYSTADFWYHSILKLSVSLGTAALFYLLYRMRKAESGETLLRFGPIVACLVLIFAAGEVDFFFARALLYAGALMIISVGLTLVPWSLVRKTGIGAAMIVTWVAFPLCLLESYLLAQNMKAYAGVSKNSGVLDFMETLAVGDPNSPGQLRPDLDSPAVRGDGTLGRIRTNAAGFRAEKELLVPKPRDEFRILFLGDSFTVGYRADQAEDVAAVLQRELQARLKKNVQVYAAMTVDQHGLLNFLRRYPGDAWDADLIVHGVCLGNDLGTSFYKAGIDHFSSPHVAVPPEHLNRENFDPDLPGDATELLRSLRASSRIVSTIRARFLPTPIWPGRKRFFGSVSLWNAQNNIGLYIKDESLQDPFYERFEELILAVHRKTGDVPFHIALYPQRSQQSDAEWEQQVRYDGLRRDSFDLDRPNRRIGALCERYGWHCLDLLPVFRENGDQLLHLPYDMHWNAAGNALAGRAIADYLQPIVEDMIR